MGSLNEYPFPPRVNLGREFHLVDLVPCDDRRGVEQLAVEARLCEIEEALKTWLRVRIAEIESMRAANNAARALDNHGIASHAHGFEEEAFMSKDERDILELLRTELDFLEKGGYGRSVRTPWKPTSPFRDSLTCVNYALPEKVHPCSECHLIDFVPADKRSEELPCHAIPLNEAGDTVESLELEDNQAKLEEALKVWMRGRIKQIEAERFATKEAI